MNPASAPEKPGLPGVGAGAAAAAPRSTIAATPGALYFRRQATQTARARNSRRCILNVLMNRTYWALGEETYAAYEDFVAAVTRYNDRIAPGKHGWNPGQVVAAGPIKVVYEALWKDEDDTIDLDIGRPGMPLTMGQILFALNNATCDFFRDADTRFFEGLAPLHEATFMLVVGS